MKKSIFRVLALVVALLIVSSCMMLDAFAATYRNGAQSGPSSSYKGGIYYKNFKKVPITGDGRTDVIAIALSQLGYQEGASDGKFSGEVSGSNNYVEMSYNLGDLGLGYGGSDYPWCACFVSWCLYQSHCTDQATYKDLARSHSGDYNYIWKEISCSQWVNQLKGAGRHSYSQYKGGSYTPKYGDLIFFQNSSTPSHIGIVLYVKGSKVYTVEGNTSDASGLESNGGGVYFKNYSLSSSYIYGYGKLPYESVSSVAKIDYSGDSPTPGLYVANASKYIYGSESDTSYDYVIDRFSMFEITKVGSNDRLYGTFTERGGSTVTGWITNNTDRIIQLSSSESSKFTFQFDANGGEGTMADQEIEYGVDTKISKCTFTKEGYTFAGWRAYRAADKTYRYTNGTDTGWYKKGEQPAGYYYSLYKDEQTIAKTGKGTGDVVKMVAYWKEYDYTVKYFANGGTGTMEDSVFPKGVQRALAKNTFTRSGYTFAGWYVYRPETGAWMYIKNGEKTGYLPGEQPDGYNIALYLDQQTVSTVCGYQKEIHLYAQWVPESTGTTSYYIDYNANGGSGEMARQKIVYGTKTETSLNEFTREGYTFLGWRGHRRSDDKWIFVDSSNTNTWLTVAEYEAAEAGAYSYKTYKPNGTVSKTSSVDMDIITFYAQWEASEYTVTFKGMDGSTLSTQTVEYGKAATAPTVPEVEGYTFVGWDVAYDSIKADTTVTAKYELVKTDFTVTFVDEDGTVLKTEVVTKGGAATAPEAPSKAADVDYIYTFAGWDKAFNSITADTTVTATYVKTAQVYYLRGSFNEWGMTDKMTAQGNGLYTATVTLEPGYYEFKAANFDYSMEWPLGTNQNITLEKDAKVTFTLDTVNNRITVDTEVIVIEYTVTFKDYNGTVLSTQKVEKGAAATAPAAPTRDGYDFAGWDKDFSSITADTTVTAKYTVKIVETKGSLKIEVVGGTGFNLSMNDGTARPQGTHYYNTKTTVGTKVTVSAKTTNSNQFIGWVNPTNNQILTTDATFTFYTGGNDSYIALYRTSITGVNVVTFKNDKSNQILDMQFYAPGDEIVIPDNPTYVGYDFDGWGMTTEQIQALLKASQDVTVTPLWVVKMVYVDVVVSGGTVVAHGGINDRGQYLANRGMIVEADEPEAGMKFAHWVDAEGRIKSYDSEYKFWPATNVALTAIYVAEDIALDYETFVYMDSCDTSGTYGTFNFSWYVPEQNGYTFMASGLVAVNKDVYNEETFIHGTTDSNVWDRSAANATASGTYNWTGPVMSGETWVAKAWVQYSDADGNVYTVYSDLLEVTKY